jgi:hypothetical protein
VKIHACTLLTAQIELIAVTPQGRLSLLVIPAQAGIQLFLNLRGRHWIPAFAGMTSKFVSGLACANRSCAKTGAYCE